MSTTPSTSPKVLTLHDLLAAHHDDAHAALSSLVTRHNELIQHHSTLLLRASALQLEKNAAIKTAERMGVENQQLWRSLKAMGTAAGGSSRPPTSRHNSENVGSREGGKSLGLTGESSNRSNPPTTLSTEGAAPRNQLDAPPAPSPFSNPCRTLAETSPILPSSRLPSRSASHASLRKAGSLDLGRVQPEEPRASTSSDVPRTPPPPSSQGEQNGTIRLPYSASMPSIASSDRPPHTPDRRLLPQLSPLAPVSPLYVQHPQDSLSPTSAQERASSFSMPSPTYSDQQLQPPRLVEAIRRNRTPSNTSTSSSAGTSSPAQIPGPLASALPAAPTGAVPSIHSTYPPPSPQDPQPSAREQRPPPPPTLSSPLTEVPPQHHSHSPRQHHHKEVEPSSSSQSQRQPARTGPPTSSPRPTLSPVFLPFTSVRVASSTIKMNERSKEVIVFLVDIVVNVPPESDPERRGGTAGWRVEKSYSEVLGLDAAVKAKTSKQETKGIGSLPDKSLFKDHAPHKSDQRKAVLERYLQTVIIIPLRDRSAVCSFFNTGVVQEAPPPPASSGSMEGWLTKRGRNFGGWQKRYYVLAHGVLSYYDARGGSKFGEINIQHAAIGRQSSQTAVAGDDAYLHAFLIRTSKKDDKEQEADHILCAENDEERDGWVVALTSVQSARGPQRSVGSSSFDHERIPAGGPAADGPLSEDVRNQHRREHSFGSVASNLVEVDSRFLPKRSASTDLPPSTSLPNSLDNMARSASDQGKRSASELGQHADMRERSSSRLQPTRRDDERNHKTSSNAERPSTPDRRGEAPPPSKLLASNVSGPMNAAPLPTGYEFKKADRRKTKSFWNFAGRGAGAGDKQAQPAAQPPSRPVFGVPLKEAVAISRIRPGLELPAIVYRSIEWLEAKNAESEEGIFRLSGSANVIRALKDRFNTEGDVNLLASPAPYDTHAIAGLLKTYLRELPVHLLTRELHPEFIQVIDLRDRKDRVNALGRLVSMLPIEEYTLLRFFFAHLCVIAQNAEVSKMGLRNLGIVFSPTLAIPAPLFSLFLAEFDLVFAVEKSTGLSRPIMVEDTGLDSTEVTASTQPSANRPRPNSAVYADSGANLMEHEGMRKLNEQADEDESTASDSAAEDALEDHDEDDDVPTSYLAFPSTPGAPPIDSNAATPRTPTPTLQPFPGPRSPGLPASPRPGATFASSSSPQ